jgi:soluble lytic murein transglycosylase-like protein
VLEILLVQHLFSVAYAPGPAVARTPATYAAYAAVLPEVACFFVEARKQSLPPELLLAVMRTEGGKRGQFVRNRNGSYDIGPMQINTTWLAELARVTGRPVAVVQETLARDVCFNIAAGAWILRLNLNAAGYDWTAVGRYNSPANPTTAARYARQVQANLRAISRELAEVSPGIVAAPLVPLP